MNEMTDAVITNKRRGFAKILAIGLLLICAGVVIRLAATDSLARWQANRMSDQTLAAEAGKHAATYPMLIEWARRIEAAGRPPEAERVYARAAEAEPAKSEAWFGMGRTAFGAGEWGRAEAVLTQTLKQWPDQAEPHFVLAGVLANTFRPNAARAHLKEGLRMDPRNRDPLLALGQLEMKLGNPAGAVEAFKRASDIGPDLPALHGPYGAALLETNHIPEAIKRLQAALKVNPSDLTARLNLGRALVKTGKAEDRMQGMKEISRVVEFSDNKAPAFLEAAKVWLAEGNRSDAEQSLEHAVDSDPSNVEAVRMLVSVYRQGTRPALAGKFEPGLRLLESRDRQRAGLKSRIEAGTDKVQNLMRLGDAAAATGDRGEATAAYTAAKGLDPTNTAADRGLQRLTKQASAR